MAAEVHFPPLLPEREKANIKNVHFLERKSNPQPIAFTNNNGTIQIIKVH